MMVKLIPSLVATLCLSCAASAFVPQNARVRNVSVKMAASENQVATGFARFFGVLTTAAVVSLHPVDATAVTNYDSVTPFASSTVHVADSVKMLDMSLPKYDDVKSYKASAENVPGLTLPAEKGGVGILGSQAKRGGMPASSVLPSMGKKTAKEKKVEKTEKVKTVDASMKYDF